MKSAEIRWIPREINQILLWNLADFMKSGNMSFWVITKYRSFLWKTKNQSSWNLEILFKNVHEIYFYI